MDYSRQSQSLSASILETRLGYLEGPDSTTATQSTVLQLGLLKAAASLLECSADGKTQFNSAAPAASASIDLSDLTGVTTLVVQHHLCESHQSCLCGVCKHCLDIAQRQGGGSQFTSGGRMHTAPGSAEAQALLLCWIWDSCKLTLMCEQWQPSARRTQSLRLASSLRMSLHLRRRSVRNWDGTESSLPLPQLRLLTRRCHCQVFSSSCCALWLWGFCMVLV